MSPFGVSRTSFERRCFRIVDEFDESLRLQLVGQSLHALTARRSHAGNLRDGERTQEGKAPQEAERAAAPTGDQAGFLTGGPDAEEALGHFEQELGDRLPLAAGRSSCPFPVSCRRHFPASVRCLSFLIDTLVVKMQNDILIVN